MHVLPARVRTMARAPALTEEPGVSVCFRQIHWKLLLEQIAIQQVSSPDG